MHHMTKYAPAKTGEYPSWETTVYPNWEISLRFKILWFMFTYNNTFSFNPESIVQTVLKIELNIFNRM